MQEEFYTVEQANQHAIAWCAKHPAWVRICETDDTRQYYVQWPELTAKAQQYWKSEYGYNEFAVKAQKIPMGYITGKGEFYDDIRAVPLMHNVMSVLKVGVSAAKSLRAQAVATS